MDQGEDLQHTTEKVPPSHVATGLRLDKERGFFVIEGEGSESGVVDEFKLTIQLIYAKNLHLVIYCPNYPVPQLRKRHFAP